MVDIKERPGTSENPYAAFMRRSASENKKIREKAIEYLSTLQKIELMQLLEIFTVVKKWFINQPSGSYESLKIVGGSRQESPQTFYFTEDGLTLDYQVREVGYNFPHAQIIGIPAALALLDSAHLGMGAVTEQLKNQIAQRGPDITHTAGALDSIMQLNDSSLEKYDLKENYLNFYKDWCSIYCVKAEEAEKKNEPEVLDYYNRLFMQFVKEGCFKQYQFRTLDAERPLVAIISDSKKAG